MDFCIFDIQPTPLPMTSESKLQQDCYLWYHNNYPALRGSLWMCHNNAKDARQGATLKAMGMVRGVSDLMMLYNGAFYAIELKTETGRQSEFQKQWQEVILSQGGTYVIVRSLQDFCNFVLSIIK